MAATPAVIEAGKPVTIKVLAAAATTVMPDWLPVSELVSVSVAVNDWLPAVFKMALKAPMPLLRPASAGRSAWASLLLK